MSSGPASRLSRILRSSSFRLAAIYACVFMVSSIVLFAMVYLTATRAMQSDMQAVQRSEAFQLAETHRRSGLPGLANEITRRMNFRTRGPIYYLLQAPTHQVVVGNLPGMPPVNGVIDFVQPAEDDTPGLQRPRLTGFGLTLADDSFIVVAQDTSRLADMQNAIERAFAWAGGLSLLLALGGGILLGNGFLRRIDSIGRTSRAIMNGDLAARIPERGTNNEIDQLVASLNAMLDRIQQLLNGMRQVSNDIAHDLRTPLGRLRQRLEDARENATTTTEYSAATEAAIAEADRLLDIFAALLRIAQIEAGAQRSAFATVDLSALARSVAEAYRPAVEESHHILTLAIDDGLVLTGDRQLLAQLFSNLIENALHHTPPGSTISLMLRGTAAGIEVEVADNGPGIPAAEREKVFERFYRLDRSRTTPGSGLGLALVKAIARLHGFSVTLGDRQPGLIVILRASK